MKSVILAAIALCHAGRLPLIDQLYDPIVDLYAQPHYTVGYTEDIPTLARIVLHYGGLSQYDPIQMLHNGKELTCLLPPDNITQYEPVPELPQEAISRAQDIFNSYAANSTQPLYQVGSYWTYVLNIGGQIVQTHPDYENDKMVLTYPPHNTYQLGGFNASTAALVKLQTRWAFSLDYNNGQYCKLVAAPRETAVYYICDPRAREAKILLQAEQRTCSYEMTVALPELCQIPEFRPVFIPQNPTICTLRDIYRALDSSKNLEPGSDLGFEQAPYSELYLERIFSNNLDEQVLAKKDRKFRVALVDQYMAD